MTAAPKTAFSPPVAHADNDSNFGGGVNAANNWNFTAAAVCLLEVAAFTVMGDYVSDHVNNCSNGNVIDAPADDDGAPDRPGSSHVGGRTRPVLRGREEMRDVVDGPESTTQLLAGT
ncbi:hypothetical protein SMICM17S_12259 [Streptomyces microflavus]